MKNEFTNMSIEELEAAFADNLESGAEIYRIGNSVWESEEEFQSELHKLTVEQNLIQEAINNKENTMNTNVNIPSGQYFRPINTNGLIKGEGLVIEDSTQNTAEFHNCHAITQKGEKCKSNVGKFHKFVLINAGKAIHEDLVKANNMPGWYRVELPFCKTHVNMLLKGKKISIQSIKKADPVPEETDLVKRVEKFTNMPVPDKHIKTKEVLCGNCRKNGSPHPYHANVNGVKACYMSK